MSNDLHNCNSEYNIELYTFYSKFTSEEKLRAVMAQATKEQMDYYFPTFDHYLDAINFSNGDYRGSSYIPDQFENYNGDNINADTQAVLSRIMSK